MDSKTEMLVRDSSCNAIAPERQHTIIYNGEPKAIDFIFGLDTILPYDIAMKFAALEGFEVIALDGRSFSLPQAVENVILNPNQVVAFYDELTLEALQIRAASMQGGEDFVDSNDRGLLVQFIKGMFIDEDEDLIDDDNDDPDAFDPNGVDTPLPVVPSLGLLDGAADGAPTGFLSGLSSASDVPPVDGPASEATENAAEDVGADGSEAEAEGADQPSDDEAQENETEAEKE